MLNNLCPPGISLALLGTIWEPSVKVYNTGIWRTRKWRPHRGLVSGAAPWGGPIIWQICCCPQPASSVSSSRESREPSSDGRNIKEYYYAAHFLHLFTKRLRDTWQRCFWRSYALCLLRCPVQPAGGFSFRWQRELLLRQINPSESLQLLTNDITSLSFDSLPCHIWI